MDAVGDEQRSELAPADRLVVEHAPGPLPHRIELLLRIVSVGCDVLDAFLQLLQGRRHPDHVELVQVRRHDGEELHALEQRVRGIERLRENALVEFEPAQLAIDVERGILEVFRIDDGRLRRERPELGFRGRGAAAAAVGPLTAVADDSRLFGSHSNVKGQSLEMAPDDFPTSYGVARSWRRAPIAHRNPAVRMNTWPSEIAGELRM
jgi:hypothetical protein